MITNFFIPELNNHDVQELWFQQDGATCHTARATIYLLKITFGDRLISRFGPVNWPPRSCDLTPLDYFLWSYVNSLAYADKPQTLDHLEDNIRRVIADIRPQMLEKSHRKLDVQIGLHPSQPWQSYSNAVSVERLANQRLHLALDEVSTLDADSLGGNSASVKTRLTQFRNTRVIGDGPHNFETRSSDEEGTPLSKLPHQREKVTVMVIHLRGTLEKALLSTHHNKLNRE
ncbi:DUF4817 domain-containing protein [Trichonephila clavipes]|nr:DUF4817 domain-containing protein [Trichonephila clavipes]